MGTTLTAVALVDEDGEEQLAIANVGDSRAYLLRDGELDQLTDDHSLVEELVRDGELTPEEAADPPAAQHPHPGPGHRARSRGRLLSASSPTAATASCCAATGSPTR